MKIKHLLITVISTTVFLLSCKKESNSNVPKDMNVRYEVTWTGSINLAYSTTGYNQLVYLNSTGNSQFDNLPSSANSYIKSVTITKDTHVKGILAESNIILKQPGSGTIKVYVDNKLVADQTANSTGLGDKNIIVLNVYWNVL